MYTIISCEEDMFRNVARQRIRGDIGAYALLFLMGYGFVVLVMSV